MIMVDLSALFERLDAVCRQALEEAGSLCIGQRGAEVTAAHMLCTLLDHPHCDVRLILKSEGLETDDLRRALSSGFAGGEGGHGQYPSFSPLLVELLQEAWLLGSVELGHTHIRSGAVLLALLLNPARYLPSPVIAFLEGVSREELRRRFDDLLASSVEATGTCLIEGPGSDTCDAPCALARFGREFTAQAREGLIDPVLCRDREIDQMVDILSRRRKNNPIVVGDAGVGKSAVVEGLALRIVQGRVPAPLRSVRLWGLDLGALQAGASVKGEFEKRLKAVIDEVKNAIHPVILFIDEAHTLIGAGNAAGGSDAANLLKPALARGELRSIAATTWTEYKKYFEKDPALARRFQLVKLEEPDPEAAVHILRGLREVHEKAHKVYISDDALRAAVMLSARYLSGRQLPDKAIDVLDTACARMATALAEAPRELIALENQLKQIDAESEQIWRDTQAGLKAKPHRLDALGCTRRQLHERIKDLREAWKRQKLVVEEIISGRSQPYSEDTASMLSGKIGHLAELHRGGVLLNAQVGAEQIAHVIASWTGIPVDTINSDQLTRLELLPALLRKRVIGQDAALAVIHQRLLTAAADLRRPETPMGVFLLVGPSGVGKTETARAVADSLFGGHRFLTTINMSEYQEKHTVSRLLGAPPGYVGHGEGGLLTEAIRRQPYGVVLLDEAEKAHPEALNVFHQAFDKGELTDGEGRQIDCRNTLFFLTSNLGFDGSEQSLSDVDDESLRRCLIGFFKPALLARMQIVPYQYLDEQVLGEIIESRLLWLQQQFARRYGATLQVSASALHELRARCTRDQNGARMLDASIDGELLPPLSMAVLKRQCQRIPFQDACVSWNGNTFQAQLD